MNSVQDLAPTQRRYPRSHPTPLLGLRLLILGLLVLMVSMPAAGQTLKGYLDFVDQDSIVGWACYEGNAASKVTVDLWAYDYTIWQWQLISRARADKERTDVGNSGICGSGTEAFYHGFEHTIFPDALLKNGGHYRVAAYARIGGIYQALSGGGTVRFNTAGFPTSSTWRTDFDDPNQKSVAMVSCIWPFKGANARGNTHPDPLHLNAGATLLGNWVPSPGTTSGPDWCVRNDPNNPSSWDWSQSNSATNAAGAWPMNNYWVISANSEIAYSKTQSGPPSQSEPINAGGVYSISASGNIFELGLDNRRPGYTPDDTPFLSFGAQMGRGISGPIGWVGPTNDSHLEFDVQQVTQSTGDYHDIYVVVELMWGGYKRFLAVSLVNSNTSRFHWNWNALRSFWFPGGEFNYSGSETLAKACSFVGSQLPKLSDATVGQWRTVSIPLDETLECLAQQNIANGHPGANGGYLGWSSAWPQNRSVAITGAHIAIEQAPGQPQSFMRARFTKPRLVQQ